MKDLSPTDIPRSTPDANHESFYAQMYSKADPHVGALKVDPTDEPAGAAINEINQEIRAYNEQNKVPAKNGGCVDVTTLTGSYSGAMILIRELQADAQNGDARERLAAISDSLGKLIRENKYPANWNIDAPNDAAADAGTTSTNAARNPNQMPFDGHDWNMVGWTQFGRSHRVLLARTGDNKITKIYVLIAKSHCRQAARTIHRRESWGKD